MRQSGFGGGKSRELVLFIVHKSQILVKGFEHQLFLTYPVPGVRNENVTAVEMIDRRRGPALALADRPTTPPPS